MKREIYQTRNSGSCRMLPTSESPLTAKPFSRRSYSWDHLQHEQHCIGEKLDQCGKCYKSFPFVALENRFVNLRQSCHYQHLGTLSHQPHCSNSASQNITSDCTQQHYLSISLASKKDRTRCQKLCHKVESCWWLVHSAFEDQMPGPLFVTMLPPFSALTWRNNRKLAEGSRLPNRNQVTSVCTTALHESPTTYG